MDHDPSLEELKRRLAEAEAALARAAEVEARLKRAEARQAMLLHELQHRVRNLLGLVRSVVRRTAEGATSVGDMQRHLEGRIDALARTQILLTRRTGAGVDVGALVYEELTAQTADEARVVVTGPPVLLAPRAAEVMSLALHELATNALKYGALQDGDGRLAIGWDVEEEAGWLWLRFDWRETGLHFTPGRARRSGFGSELIGRRVPYELGGRGALEVEAGGVHAHIAFPLVPGQSILDTAPPVAGIDDWGSSNGLH